MAYNGVSIVFFQKNNKKKKKNGRTTMPRYNNNNQNYSGQEILFFIYPNIIYRLFLQLVDFTFLQLTTIK